MRTEKRGLGRGLDSLIGNLGTDTSQSKNKFGIREIPVEQLSPNPFQPRTEFSEETLNELASSIITSGVIQPLIIRPDPERSDHFQIVAGERRWRAAQRAKLDQVPALIRNLSDNDTLEIALVENIQRADLNAIDEARAYRVLIERLDLTQQQLSEKIGRSRVHIANTLRLLNLPDRIKALVKNNELTAGHARALLASNDPERHAELVTRKGLTVRQTEDLVAKFKGSTGIKSRKTADTRLLEANLAANLAAKVSINLSKKGESGKFVIQFSSINDFQRLYQMLVNINIKEK